MLSNSTHAVLLVLEDIGSVKALSLAVMARYKDFSGLAHIEAQPSHYVDPLSYFKDAQAIALFSKRADLKIDDIDTKSVAIEKWWQAERACYKSNERLSPFLYSSYPESEKAIADFLIDVREKVRSWIGSSPPDLERVRGKFGPGATFSDRGRLTTVADKMSSRPTLTPDAYWHILPYLSTMWGRNNVSSGRPPCYIRGNRFTTVPKNFKTDRGIAVEPSINLFYQLGLGSAIRRRLAASTGWDLGTAQDIHGRKAMEGSVTGELATLDLSSASDTVCTSLVKLVLPHQWWARLSELRSPFTLLEGRWVRLEKFSSMGNGYTFELETLIFAAITSTWLERCGRDGKLGSDFFVYGDDIIVPSDTSKSLVTVLSFLGFTTNLSKTFHDGPFRESCGADYWSGRDVRPVFCKELPDGPFESFPFINGIRLIYDKLASLGHSIEPRGHSYLINCLPMSIRNLRGPKELGDLVLTYPEAQWRFRWKDSIRYFRTLSPRVKAIPWYHWKSDVVLACATYGVGSGSEGITPRDGVLSYRLSWTAFS